MADHRVLLTITARSSAVKVTATAGADVAVRKGAIEPDGPGRWCISSDGTAIEIVCPEGADLAIASSSGRVECRGSFGEVKVTTSSGRVEIDQAVVIDVRTTSGRVVVDSVARGTVRTTSSRVEIAHADTADVATSSGRVTIGDASGVSVQTVSGTVAVGVRSRPDARIRTISAKVIVDLPPRATPLLDLRSGSGRIESSCTSGDDGHVDVETGSGAITVTCR